MLLSIIEMYVGVIVACLPSVSRVAHLYLPRCKEFASRVYSWTHISKNNRRFGLERKYPLPNRIYSSLRLTDGGTNSSTNLELCYSAGPRKPDDAHLELGQFEKTVKTYIHAGDQNYPTTDKIYLTREIHQY